MNFPTAIRTCLKEKYADFRGRAPRSEYWYFELFFGLIMLLTTLIALASGTDSGFVLPAIAFFALFLPHVAVFARRLHDLNKSGWWILLMLLNGIPYVGFLVSIGFIVICAFRGTIGPNRYGEDPLESTDSQQRLDA